MGLQVLQNLESPKQIELPAPVFQIYDIVEQNLSSRNWKNMKDFSLWKNLCLCILSSNVNFELAKSALEHLVNCELLEPSAILKKKKTRQKLILKELQKSIFKPRKKDGGYRKYRFPLRRSIDLVCAANEIYVNWKDLKYFLKIMKSEESARYHLLKVSGLGLKESSHFLRNIGYSSSLAIIDVHIISFLKELEIIDTEKSTVTTKEYLELEKIMQHISRKNNLNLSILDNAIWHYMRNKTN